MKKYLLDLTVKSVERIHERYVLIKLTDEQPLPEMLPGQFVEIRVDGSIDVSMSEYVIGPCGGDSELLWSYSLWGGGNSVGVNELKEHSAEEIGSWKLSIECPDEYYFDEESEESGNEEE